MLFELYTTNSFSQHPRRRFILSYFLALPGSHLQGPDYHLFDAMVVAAPLYYRVVIYLNLEDICLEGLGQASLPLGRVCTLDHGHGLMSQDDEMDGLYYCR